MKVQWYGPTVLALACALALAGCGNGDRTGHVEAEKIAKPREEYPTTPVQGRNWRVPGIGMEFAHVAPGTFQMGTDTGEPNEGPPRKIRISRGFWIGRYEVTQEEFVPLMAWAPGAFESPRAPVSGVARETVQRYCELLTERERGGGRLPLGYEYRMPTEAEWEYAARGGSKSRGTVYSGSDVPNEVAWYAGNSPGRPGEVGGRNPNELGIRDMSGNVGEMCFGVCSEEWYARCPVADPVGLGFKDCVARGGNWESSSDDLRVTVREWYWSGQSSPRVGVRLCLGPRTDGAGMEPTPPGGGVEPAPETVADTEDRTIGTPSQGMEWTVPGIGLTLVPVEAGAFEMGRDRAAGEMLFRPDLAAMPAHPVRISRPYWIGKLEVSNAEHAALMEDKPLAEKYRSYPRMDNWYDATLFCVRLTGRERRAGRLPGGYEYRLPTEAEWEYAARGGSKSRGCAYSGSDDPDEVAWYKVTSGGGNAREIQPVGGRKPNELGIHDMSGNVAEWCLDRYDATFYAVSPEVDPLCTRGPGTDEHASSIRGSNVYGFGPGGDGYESASFMSSARVTWRDKLYRSHHWAGFRVCLAPAIRYRSPE